MSAAPDIFISYAHPDRETARRFADAFAAEGLEVWWDNSLQAGEIFDERIEAALRAAKAVVVLWSPHSVASRWVRAEATLADRNKTLVPAMIAPCERPIVFELTHTAALSHWRGDGADAAWQAFLGNIRRMVGDDAPRAAAVPANALPRLDQLSIVVLPFANMSSDPEQDYFADGISEDIITDLSKVSALAVISRNSSFTFKGKHVDLPDIARQLNVTHVLEGSVRKSGNRVRVTAQLIDGSTNDHVWADRYDRDLDDIFALQDELSQAIVEALKLKLLPQEKEAIEDRGTDNAEAYDLYLRAQSQYRIRNAAGIRRAFELVESALEIDPDFAQAWLFLGQTYLIAGVYMPESTAQAREKSIAAFRQTIERRPGSVLALAAEATLAMFRSDWLAVEAVAGKQRELLLKMPFDTPGLAYYLIAVGRVRDAAEEYRGLVRGDPLATVEMVQFTYICAGSTEEAVAERKRVLKIVGDSAISEFFETTRVLAAGPPEAAREALAHYLMLKDGYLPVLDHVLKVFDDRPAALAVVRQASGEPFYQDFAHLTGLAYFAVYFGDAKLAVECLYRAFVEMRGVTIAVLWHPLFDEARKTDRFKQILRERGIYDYWRKSGHWGDFARPLGADDFEIIA